MSRYIDGSGAIGALGGHCMGMRCVGGGVVLVVALAGCQRYSVELDNTSTFDVSMAEAAYNKHPQPGRWESSLKLTATSGDTLPSAVASMLTRSDNLGMIPGLSPGQEVLGAYCMLPAEISWPSSLWRRPMNFPRCSFDHFAAREGEMTGAWTCTMDGATVHGSAIGTFDETRAHFTNTVDTVTTDGRHAAMTYEMDTHRTGPCGGETASGVAFTKL